MSELRDRILASREGRDRPAPLYVEEWGETVWIRILSAGDQEMMSESGGGSKFELPVRVMIRALVDEAGEPIFTEEDLPALMAEDFPVVFRVFAAVAKANGLTTAELDEAIARFPGRSGPAPDLPDSARAREDGRRDRADDEFAGAYGVGGV
jgi:hypothetical protein